MSKNRFTTGNILLGAGVFFLILGIIEILFQLKTGNSVIVGTIYIVGAIIVNTIKLYSLPYSVSNHLKPEVIDLLDWTGTHLPQSNHPDLCAEFVKEFKEKYHAALESDNVKVDTV